MNRLKDLRPPSSANNVSGSSLKIKACVSLDVLVDEVAVMKDGRTALTGPEEC